MNWLDFIGKLSIVSIVLALVILIFVGYANGGKYRTSPFDPALKNEITIGKKWLLLAVGLIISSAILAVIVVIVGP